MRSFWHLLTVSLQPVPGSYLHQPQHGAIGQSTLTTYPAYGHQPTTSEAASIYSYDQPLTPNGQPSSHLQHNSAGQIHPYTFTQGYQQPPYEAASPTYQISGRGPRHSVPTSSSGFMPIQQPSGFTSLASHVSEPSGFAPPPSHTPAPMGYNSQFHPHPQAIYPPPLSNTPVPTSNSSYLHHSTSLSFHPQQSFPASQSYNYTTYSIPQSTSAPPQHFASPPIQSNAPQPTNSAPPQLYSAITSTHEIQSTPASHANGQTSRPLPQQPQVVYTQQQIQQQQQAHPIPTSHSLPSQGGLSQSANSYSPTQPANSYLLTNGFSPIPPPPPPPSLQHNTTAPVVQTTSNLPVPPPPPPPPPSNIQPRRRASLPQPPISYQQPLPQPIYQQLPPPPPPPPPIEYYGQNPLPPPPPPHLLDTMGNAHKPTIYQQGLPPKPPAPVDEYGQWTQRGNSNSPNF